MTSAGTNESKCVLAAHCKNAGGPSCNAMCGAWVGVMGHNGRGGRVAAAGLPDDYARLTLANSPARDNQASAYRKLALYADTFSRQFDPEAERIKSLYLYSDEPGTGKTTSAAALVNEWIIRHYIGSIQRGLTPHERPALFVDVNAWQTLFLGFNRSHVPQETAEPIAREYYAMEQRAKAAPFVVLDDIGVRSASDAFRADLHGVVNHRVTNGLPTVYTSNVALADLSAIFDRRLADRIRDMCVDVAFVGESKRGIRKSA
ncbi:DNA replication protein [Paenibacillus sp. FSL R7-269]|uniref:DNA replication protein n=1 Tax=Paenibacillus sp. FSL R7-269 TaxID=1226755 RepID=UPI0003E28DFE|nr:DNA replication protein [Paenibacillus sp. FSL R7-269]ETT40925.1 DNA replication protein [Paenibacillus sp. FSL R7-269]